MIPLTSKGMDWMYAYNPREAHASTANVRPA